MLYRLIVVPIAKLACTRGLSKIVQRSKIHVMFKYLEKRLMQ